MTSRAADPGPVQRLAGRLRSLAGWRRGLAAILAGGIASLSLPPADALPLLWISMPALIWLLDGAKTRKAAFWVGWCFGFGYLAVGLYWLTVALFVDIGRYWWLVPFASNGLAAGLAIFWGGAGAVASIIPVNRPLARATGVAAAVSLFEWLRGHVLTGFPWNLPGYAWTDYAWLAQTSAAIGVYGVTVLALLAPALVAPLGSPFAERRLARNSALGGFTILAAAAIAGYARLPAEAVPSVPGVRLRLVQPSIPQSLKWVEEREAENIRRHIALSRQPASQQPNVIIWPEAALPFSLEAFSPEARARLAELLPPGGLLITGTFRETVGANPPTYRDSLEALDASGRIVAQYDKFHYVPFGEYMPLRRWLPILEAVAAGGMEPDPGPGPMTIRMPGLPPVSPLICYEVIFPHDVADEVHRPEWLLEVTNDAWFGRTAGPHQHFAMARMRAIEEGLPLANAANDGISGIVDPYGRVLERLGLGEIGVIDADLPQPAPATLYSRVGDRPFFAMVAIIALMPIAVRLRSGN